MKNIRKISIASIVFFILHTLSFSVSAGSLLGEETIRQSTVQIAPGTTLTSSSFYNSDVGQQIENFFTYKPNSKVLPTIAYGSKLFGRSNITQIANYLIDNGKKPIAGINSDYFSLETGIPMGPVIVDGKLVSSDAGAYAVGFKEDGSAFIGKPEVSMVLSTADQKVTIDHFNKYRQPYCLYMLSDDFSAATQNKTPGVDVILGSIKGNLSIGQTITAVVEEVTPYDSSIQIPQGKLVLTMDNNGPADKFALISSLQVGQEVSIAVSSPDQRWNTVKQAVGGYEVLLSNGEITKGLAVGAAPRTAIGIKKDGSVVLYTIDGRQYGYSFGVQLETLADRLKEIGCVEALNLDGGGSTSTTIQYPGTDQLQVINSPSDGALRKCANFIFLLNNQTPTGKLGGIYAYPYENHLLSGASVQLFMEAVDTGYYHMGLPDNIQYTVKQSSTSATTVPSTFKDNTLTAYGTDNLNILAAYGDANTPLTVQAAVYSYETPGSILVKNEATNEQVGDLSLNKRDELNLTASAFIGHRALISQDSCYTWQVEGNIGTVDNTGKFTASNIAGAQGKIKISAGNCSTVLNVRINDISTDITKNPFTDTKGHWAAPYITYLYTNGGVKGYVDSKGVRTFAPESMLTRVEFAVMAANYLRVDPNAYKDTVLPYKDAKDIPSWAINQVKALYSLGIMSGRQNGANLVFDSRANLTRAEAMTILGRSMSSYTQQPDISFKDSNDIPEWALPYVKTLVGLGIVSGNDSGQLLPNNSLKRAEAAKILSIVY